MDSMQSFFSSFKPPPLEVSTPLSLVALMESDITAPEELLPLWISQDSSLDQQSISVHDPDPYLEDFFCTAEIPSTFDFDQDGLPLSQWIAPSQSLPNELPQGSVLSCTPIVPLALKTSLTSGERTDITFSFDNNTAGYNYLGENPLTFTEWQNSSVEAQEQLEVANAGVAGQDWTEAAGTAAAFSMPCYPDGLGLCGSGYGTFYNGAMPWDDGYLDVSQEYPVSQIQHYPANLAYGLMYFNQQQQQQQPHGHQHQLHQLKQDSIPHTSALRDNDRCPLPPPRRLQHSYSPPPTIPFPKRRRRLTAQEATFLQTQFKINERPTAQERDRIAKHLSLDRKTIQVWFQNKRAKVKRDTRGCYRDMIETEVEIEDEADLETDTGGNLVRTDMVQLPEYGSLAFRPTYQANGALRGRWNQGLNHHVDPSSLQMQSQQWRDLWPVGW
ncbi:hypothetical protein BGX28_002669 [Mortierella sp. GBA30]|nr:hypothetical protein BGX28_002669 [Mortierella sp. GBA30]